MEVKENFVYNCDCLDLMQSLVERGIVADWLITDPPYGIGYTSLCGGGDNICSRRSYSKKNWDCKRLPKKYFNLMFNCSKNQIIFGGNYYTDYLPPTKSWIIWNKRDYDVHNDFADCELAWCSKGQSRVFTYLYQGMLQGNMKNKDVRFHPTQKPVAIWVKLLNYYTKENDLILDPFAGSLSLAVACYRTNRRYICCEKDIEYYEKGMKWLEKEKSQISFFDMFNKKL